MTDIIDPTKTFRLLEQRIAKTTNPRHLLMLNRVLQHAMGEAKPDLDLVMSTLCPPPCCCPIPEPPLYRLGRARGFQSGRAGGGPRVL